MSADLPPCVLCAYCTDQTSYLPYEDRSGAVAVRISHKLIRSCGAGPTNNPDERCVNGKYIERQTVVLYTSNNMANSETFATSEPVENVG